MAKYYLAVDIGATKTLLGLFNQNSELIYKIKFSTYKNDFKDNVKEIKKSVQDYFGSCAENGEIIGAGVGIPAIYDSKNDIIQKSANLYKWENTKIRENLEAELNAKTCVHTDVYAALIGEKIFGAAKQASNFINISVGTGIGMGIFINNAMYTGRSGNAGGIGHTIYQTNGLACNCGKKGCLENYVCGKAIERMFYERINDARYKTAVLYKLYAEGKKVTSFDIIKAAYSKDPLCTEIINIVGFNLGIAISNIIMLYDPETIILNGGIILNSPPILMDTMKKTITDNMYPEVCEKIEIKKTLLGEDSNLYGNYWIIKNYLDGVKI
jgi:glucokinase